MIQTQIASTPKLRSRWLGRFSCLALAGALVGSFAPSAQAGGFFDSLFGGFIGQQRSAPAYSYADPRGDVAQRGDPNIRVETPAPSSSGGGKAFCVRLCDGRYFPLQRSSGASPSEMCSKLCPAAETKVFYGGSIDHASTPGCPSGPELTFP